jgi:hypothetical protein
MSSLLQAVRAWAPKVIDHDPIVGGFLRHFTAYQPYSRREVSELVMGERGWEKEADRIGRFCPAMVTVGGDYLDFVLAVGRVDLARSALGRYRQLSQELHIPLVMTSYTGCCTIGDELVTLLAELYDAILVPINPQGLGMLPDPTALLSWAHRLGKPIMAMHALGSGRISVRDGLAYAFTEAGAAAAIVGASTHEHIDALVRSGQAILGGGL